MECFWQKISFLFFFYLIGVPFSCSAGYLEDIQELALGGDPEAQLTLALLYEYGGEGVDRDTDMSFFWLEKAGMSCLPCACLYLGIKYENGSGVSRDLSKAVMFYRCAARQDWPAAQFFLGRLLAAGKGAKQDSLQALALFSLAAEHAYPGAEEAYSELFAKNHGISLRILQDKQVQLLEERPFCN